MGGCAHVQAEGTHRMLMPCCSMSLNFMVRGNGTFTARAGGGIQKNPDMRKHMHVHKDWAMPKRRVRCTSVLGVHASACVVGGV